MSFSPGLLRKKKKKSFNFQAMAPSKMSAPMVETYAQREVIFCDEKLLIRPYSQVRLMISRYKKYFNNMWVS